MGSALLFRQSCLYSLWSEKKNHKKKKKKSSKRRKTFWPQGFALLPRFIEVWVFALKLCV